ncbi:MAG: 16S rRNA (guanine(527)-N(7))-methyltransferase RsmG [Coprobacillus sp.]|nr:16S rRNA (guanine(527)-N(7))-methyltransferase RsmG [Coprobacillus sp.]
MDSEHIKKVFSDSGIDISSEISYQLLLLMELTLEANEKMNLTAITDEEEFVNKMLLDSVLVSKDIDLSKGKLLDIGSGAGFPALPLAIMFPNLNVTLLDSTSKKVKHCEEVVEKLGLTNVTCVDKRAEEYINGHRETFDFVTARALATLPIVIELSIPFVKVGGTLIAYKGISYKDEVKSSHRAFVNLSCKIGKTIEYTLPYSDEKRVYLLISKYEKTKDKYPREYSIISRNPL